MKGKSMSTPPPHLGIGHLLPNGKHKSTEKKGSDPTPLRNSIVGNGLELQPVESPASIRNSTDGDADRDSLTSRSMTGGQDSASSSMYPGTSTASSSTSYLAVPGVRDGGSFRHSSEEIPGSNGHTPTLTPTPAPAPGAAMERSASRQTMSKLKSTVNASTHRSGTTANKPLDKNHTCTWDQELNFQLRIPIQKPEKGSKSKPILGEGSKSASGLRLMIQQLPTPYATTITQPKSTIDAEVHHSPAHSAAIHKASTSTSTGMEKQDSEEGGKYERIGTHHAKGKVTAFGRVNIDLAAFAGRGRTTRKFLLGGSRTNATVQITVEMIWIGGDRDWVA